MRSIIANIEALGTRPTQSFQFRGTNDPSYHIWQDQKTKNITIEYLQGTFGTKFHKTKHAYQYISNEGLRFTGDGLLKFASLAIKGRLEIQAYRVQYAYSGRTHFPTSMKIRSIYDIDYTWLASIEDNNGGHPYKAAAQAAEAEYLQRIKKRKTINRHERIFLHIRICNMCSKFSI